MQNFEQSEDFQELALLMAERMSGKNDMAFYHQIKALEALSHETDPKLLMLPHPARVTHMKHLDMSKLTYGKEWEAASKIIADNSITLHDTANKLLDTSEFFRLHYGAAALAPTGSNGGNANNAVLALRFALNRGHIFQTTDALDEQLQHTDIADTIPVSQIRPPYPITYFEFGQSRKSPFFVYNDLTGAHVAEGCYLFEQKTDSFAGKPYKEHRHLVVMLTGMPKAHISDDATSIYTIPLLDEDLSIADTIAKFIELHQEDIRNARGSSYKMRLAEANPLEVIELEKILKHLMKIMLYLSTARAVKTTENERSELQKSLAAIKSSAKRAKAERKLEKTYDRIVIGPKELPTPQDMPAGTSGRQVSPHWRRGHFRDQRHGEGNKLVKTIFIEPQLIAAERIADAADAPTKTYVVK